MLSVKIAVCSPMMNTDDMEKSVMTDKYDLESTAIIGAL